MSQSGNGKQNILLGWPKMKRIVFNLYALHMQIMQNRTFYKRQVYLKHHPKRNLRDIILFSTLVNSCYCMFHLS